MKAKPLASRSHICVSPASAGVPVAQVCLTCLRRRPCLDQDLLHAAPEVGDNLGLKGRGRRPGGRRIQPRGKKGVRGLEGGFAIDGKQGPAMTSPVL
jgi:hypothetical protein